MISEIRPTLIGKDLIPASWKTVKLSDIASVQSGVGFPEKYQGKSNGDLPFAKVSDISAAVSRSNGIIISAQNYVSIEIAKELNGKIFPPDSILFAKIGEAIKLNRRVITGTALLADNNVMGVIPDTKEVLPLFLFYFLKTVDLFEYSQATTVPSVRKSDIENISIPLPPIEDQKYIVDKLTKLSAQTRTARAALERIPAQLKAFRQSVLAAAFRGELTERDPNDEPAAALLERIRAERRRRWEENLLARGKDPARVKYDEPPAPDTSGLPALPEGWVWTTLGFLLDRIEAGHSFKAQGRPAQKGEFGVIKVSAMTWGKFLPEENKALLSDTDPGNTPRVCKDDLLISRANTVELVGAVVLIEEDYPNLLLSDKSLRLVPISPEISKEFLLYALRTRPVRDVFEGEATGVSESMRNISQDKIRNTPIALSPLNEQAQIIEKINQANAQSNAIERAVATGLRRLDEFERSALTKAFRAELL